jgi:hypothetical protein
MVIDLPKTMTDIIVIKLSGPISVQVNPSMILQLKEMAVQS